MNQARRLLVSGAPFIHHERTMARDAWLVSSLLLPILGWEFLLSGPTLLVGAGLSLGAALVSDLIQSGLRRRFELDDGSAFLTGLLIALTLPSGLPIFVPAAASAFAILIIKGAFGGLGNNWMNPALGGVAFAWLNWPQAFSSAFHAQASGGPAFVSGLPSLIVGVDDRLSALANALVFQPLGANLPSGYFSTLLGYHQGGQAGIPMGLVLLASAVLIGLRVVRWQIPASIFVAFAIPVWIFGDLASGSYFMGDPLGQTLGGSFLLIAFFMATDPVTSPSRSIRMLIYGAGIGLLDFLLVIAGSKLLAPVLAVLLMNALMPLIDETGERIARRGRS